LISFKDKELKGMSEEEQQMAKLMGFASFDTTKVQYYPS